MTVTIAVETRRKAILHLGFRESFAEDSLTAGYERRPIWSQEPNQPRRAVGNVPAGLLLMPSHLADQLQAVWEEHGSRVYVVRSHGIPIAWTVVGLDDSKLTVPRYRYPRQLTERHQALARRA